MHRRILLLLLSSVSSIACAGSAAVDAFSQPVLLGMQLSVKQGARKSAMPEEQLACVQRLKPSAFYAVVEEVMNSALTPPEVAEASRFFGTSVGQKYLKHGLLRIYPAVGERAPEPLPDFSDSEYKELEVFAAAPTGQALITRQVMQSVAAKQAYATRIRELLEQCRAK
jgi:hypothetical protein